MANIVRVTPSGVLTETGSVTRVTSSGVVTETSGGGGAPPPTAVTLNGPSTGGVNVASTNFNVGVDNTGIVGTLVVTPATDVGSGGTFAPTTVSLTAASPSGTFTFTPSKSGVHNVSVTNNGGLTNPSAVPYTVKPAVTVTLVNSPSDATPQANLTGLHWRWIDSTDYANTEAPSDVGATGTTNGSGIFTAALPNSTKTNGQTGILTIANSAGTTVATGVVAVT